MAIWYAAPRPPITTADAIRNGLDGLPRLPSDEIPFASARKWSALAFAQPERRGTYALGAIEMLAPYLPPEALAMDGPLMQQSAAWSEQGLRVLLFAYNPHVTTLHDDAGEPLLPALMPLALVSLSDELRPQVKETLTGIP